MEVDDNEETSLTEDNCAASLNTNDIKYDGDNIIITDDAIPPDEPHMTWPNQKKFEADNIEGNLESIHMRQDQLKSMEKEQVEMLNIINVEKEELNIKKN
eukprot:UN29228